MKPGKIIDSIESDKMKNMYSTLISSHNTLCDIERVFVENEIAKEYFDEAENDVLSSGNCGLSTMIVIAIERMADDISDYRDDEEKMDSALSTLREMKTLREENQKLKLTLENILSKINQCML